jgi:hypothetical protein
MSRKNIQTIAQLRQRLVVLPIWRYYCDRSLLAIRAIVDRVILHIRQCALVGIKRFP